MTNKMEFLSVPQTLCAAALDVLLTAEAQDKARKTRHYAALWHDKTISALGQIDGAHMPSRPARPERPVLLLPRDMPKRKKGDSVRNKIILLHALSHIELNAIDLAWDIIARFGFYHTAQQGFSLPIEFYEDWLKVAADEAKHFLMLADRMAALGGAYGDYPAHDGLWESAEKTAGDFAARLAIVPMVLEARGLDVTPHMIMQMTQQGDRDTADLLTIIHDDEITHVRAGTVWFKAYCDFHGFDQEEHFQALVRQYFTGPLKAPFNHPSREEACMIRDWYEPLADQI